MKKYRRIITGIALTVVCVVLQMSTVFAAGTVSASGDKESANVGDTYTVNVSVEGADGDSVAPEVSVNYDANRLEFVSCTGEYGGGGGGLVSINGTSAEVVFNILSGGQADVVVTAVFEGDGANQQTVTATVMVEGEDTAAQNAPASEDSGTGIEAGSVATPDGKLVSAVFADEIMPVGFYKTTVSYEEQMVEAAQFDMGGIVLLYVTDMDGNNGNFDIYDQATGELSDFLQLSGIENRFIVALKAPEGVEAPKDFAKAVLQWNAQTLEAYAYTGGATGNVNAADFFLIYAVSSEGNTGWYMYDQNEGTYQRFADGLYSGGSSASSGEDLISQITSPVTTDGDEESVNVVFIIAVALAVLLLILIITVIVMAVKLHEYNSYDYIDEDEEGGENYLQNLAQSKETMGRPVARDEDDVRVREVPTESEERIEIRADRDEMRNPVHEDVRANVHDSLPDEMPKSKNIYEQFRDEDERDDNPNDRRSDQIPDEFVVRKKKAPMDIDDDLEEKDIDDDGDLFSPRGRGDRMSRADKKAMKAEEKARKKAEKRMKKEYGEYGPVDWESWQNGVEGGEKTATAYMNRSDDDEAPVRRAPHEIREERQRMEEMQARREMTQGNPGRMTEESGRGRDEEIVRQRPDRYDEPMEPQDMGNVRGQGKGNPMDMMRGIPANDNKAPVQAKPVQQFDFDDDFEFEFLDLDDDD